MNTESEKKWVVITSIHSPQQMKNGLRNYAELGYRVCIVGDRKSPSDEWKELASRSEFLVYLSLDQQQSLFPELSSLIGFDCYARKNIGYLFAMMQGAEVIWETDDDTFPRDNVGDPLEYVNEGFEIGNTQASSGSSSMVWNPFEFFAPNELLWPRGFPLQEVSKIGSQEPVVPGSNGYKSPLNGGLFDARVDIFQTLVNLEPDLDAIYRLVFGATQLSYPPSRQFVTLGSRWFAPGNTQSTFWLNPAKFSWMYFPFSPSDRFADILKLYVAQAGASLAYGGFLSEQFRNPHDLMSDLRLEVPLYNGLSRLLEIVAEEKGAEPDMQSIYQRLFESDICSEEDVRGAQLFEKSVNEILDR